VRWRLQQALEAFIERVVFGAEIQVTDPSAVDELLRSLQVSEIECQALRLQLPRAVVYRQLVQGTLREAIELALPRLFQRMGGIFDEYLQKFLRDVGPRTHYLRDVTAEFLDFSEPLWDADLRVPRWARDLARHEALRIEVAACRHSSYPEMHQELNLAAAVRFTESSRLMHYQYAVHELSAELSDRTEPEARPTDLLVYRSADHDVRYLELSPLAASILGNLLSHHHPLGHALSLAYAEHGVEFNEQHMQSTALLLADLAERGALLGPMPERSP